MNYKAHLFASLGNGKLHPQRMQCGRHLFRNGKGTHVVKSTEFKRLFLEDKAAVCEKCLEWAKQNKQLTN
jgi:hypothetical protein